MNKLSIIIPVFKTPTDLLDKCVQSIIAQTYINMEIFLVDDGSPDNCGVLCDQYAKTDDRIIVIHKDNHGVSSARNAALKQLTGDFLTFIDSDDSIIDIEAYSNIINMMETENADCAVFGWHEVYKNSNHFDSHRVTTTLQTIDASEASKRIAADDFDCGGGYPWNKVWRVSCLTHDNVPLLLFDESLCSYEDKLWILENLKKLKTVLLVPETYYEYTFSISGLSKDSDFWENRILNSLDAYLKIIDLFEEESQARTSALRFFNRFIIDCTFAAYRGRRWNIGHLQRMKQCFFLNRKYIKMRYIPCEKQRVKYMILCLFFYIL